MKCDECPSGPRYPGKKKFATPTLFHKVTVVTAELSCHTTPPHPQPTHTTLAALQSLLTASLPSRSAKVGHWVGENNAIMSPSAALEDYATLSLSLPPIPRRWGDWGGGGGGWRGEKGRAPCFHLLRAGSLWWISRVGAAQWRPLENYAS